MPVVRRLAALALTTALLTACGSTATTSTTSDDRPAAAELAASFDAYTDRPASEAQLACVGGRLVDSDLSDRDLRSLADDFDTGFTRLSDDSFRRTQRGQEGPFAFDTLGAIMLRCLQG